MPQSLHQVYGHLVFSTKDRQLMIHGGIEAKLYAYLGGITRDMGGVPILINGMPDHVHLLIRAGKKVADMDFIGQLKGGSSKWMSEQGVEGFKWQAGYGWFSVGARDLAVAKTYVERQKQHHEKLSFKDEFRRFLKKYAVEFDERYVWD